MKKQKSLQSNNQIGAVTFSPKATFPDNDFPMTTIGNIKVNFSTYLGFELVYLLSSVKEKTPVACTIKVLHDHKLRFITYDRNL